MEGNPHPLTQLQHLSVPPGCYTHHLEDSQWLTARQYWQDINAPLSIPLVMEIKKAFAYLFQFLVKKKRKLSVLFGLAPLTLRSVSRPNYSSFGKRGYFNFSSTAAVGQADKLIDRVRRSGQWGSSGKTGLNHTMEVLKGFIGCTVMATCSDCCRWLLSARTTFPSHVYLSLFCAIK